MSVRRHHTVSREIPSGTTVPARFTPAEGLAWIERQWGRADKGEGLSLAIADVESGEALGNINLLFRRQPLTAEIGYWLIPGVRGRGLGSRVIALFARWAVTGAGLARLEALVVPGNMASQRVLEKAGFRRRLARNGSQARVPLRLSTQPLGDEALLRCARRLRDPRVTGRESMVYQ